MIELLVALALSWRAQAERVLPSFVDDESVMVKASAMLALSAVSDADGSAAAVEGIVSDAEGLMAHARLADMEHGDVSVERSWHAWRRDITLTFRADGTPVCTVPSHAGAPDAMEGSRHAVRRGRNKRGTTQVVVAFGHANVIGGWHGAPNMETLECESYPTLAAVMGARSGAFGTNALDVLRVTERAYARRGLEPLLGSDVRAWSEMTPARIGVKPDRDEEGNPVYGDWQIADTFGATRTRTRDESANTDLGNAAPSIARHGTRRRLSVPRKRKGESFAPVRAHWAANAYAWQPLALCAPAADRDHVWRGHRFTLRPNATGGRTVNGARKRTVRVARNVGPTYAAATRANLLTHLASVPTGARTVWTLGALSGTFTLSPNKRYNIGIKWADGKRTESRRTLDALDRIVERCEYLSTVPA